MLWRPERRYPPGPRPCIGAEVLCQVLADKRSAHLLSADIATAEDGGRLERMQVFFAHAAAFLIGAWNLFMINCAHVSSGWWFWLPVAAWSALVALHGVVIVLADWWRGVSPHPSSSKGQTDDERGTYADRALDFHVTSVTIGDVADDA